MRFCLWLVPGCGEAAALAVNSRPVGPKRAPSQGSSAQLGEESRPMPGACLTSEGREEVEEGV